MTLYYTSGVIILSTDITYIVQYMLSFSQNEDTNLLRQILNNLRNHSCVSEQKVSFSFTLAFTLLADNFVCK